MQLHDTILRVGRVAGLVVATVWLPFLPVILSLSFILRYNLGSTASLTSSYRKEESKNEDHSLLFWLDMIYNEVAEEMGNPWGEKRPRRRLSVVTTTWWQQGHLHQHSPGTHALYPSSVMSHPPLYEDFWLRQEKAHYCMYLLCVLCAGVRIAGEMWWTTSCMTKKTRPHCHHHHHHRQLFNSVEGWFSDAWHPARDCRIEIFLPVVCREHDIFTHTYHLRKRDRPGAKLYSPRKKTADRLA